MRDMGPDVTFHDGAANGTIKRRKLVTDAKTKSSGGSKVQDDKPSNANEEFPNGFFYCHQCAKKRDALRQ